jgi:hypothetical protein
MDPRDCVDKTYVKFRYIPPPKPAEPMDCKHVIITQGPDLRVFTGQISQLEGRPRDKIIGIDLHCSFISTAGPGSIVFVVQVSSYIEWEMGFMSKQGNYVHELHRLFFSIPMAHKITGPRIALSAISPWKLKLANYAGQIAVAFKKLDDVEDLIKRVTALKKGACREHIKAFVEELKSLEGSMNNMIRGRMLGFDGGELAKRIERNIHGFPRFVGNVLT